MFWPKLTSDRIKQRIFNALSKNVNYRENSVLGIPGTYLDAEVFYDDAPFLSNAPFLSTLIANPNHIGCHTLGKSLDLFTGTQEIERELIRICSEQIFKGDKEQQDGYIASGGTEANIQAMWIYRNYFIAEYGASLNEITIICSEDSHYSIPKGANLLGIDLICSKVNENDREIEWNDFHTKIESALHMGKKYFIIILNLSTTMFGSVDNINDITVLLDLKKINYKVHIDAAFGGFIYPFTNPDSHFTFLNKAISSFTIDAHKMLQTPYGTGIFLIRKGYMKYVQTTQAQYIPGTDYTLCGSRSGANAIAIWMILHSHGSEGWSLKMKSLVDRTSELCLLFDELKIRYFRNPFLNIIAIHANSVNSTIAEKYHLVADTYEKKPSWWKIVMMPHISRGTIDALLNDLRSYSVNC